MSIGATGRTLLEDGATLDTILPDLLGRARDAAGSVGLGATAVLGLTAVAGGIAMAVRSAGRRASDSGRG